MERLSRPRGSNLRSTALAQSHGRIGGPPATMLAPSFWWGRHEEAGPRGGPRAWNVQIPPARPAWRRERNGSRRNNRFFSFRFLDDGATPNSCVPLFSSKDELLLYRALPRAPHVWGKESDPDVTKKYWALPKRSICTFPGKTTRSRVPARAAVAGRAISKTSDITCRIPP